MPNYQNGKIYKLVCDDPEKIYIGSTTQQLYKRLAEHKSKRTCTSSILFEIGGIKIILLENYPCNSREELTARERYYFDMLPNVNTRRPFRTEKEYKDIKQSDTKLYSDRHRMKCECGSFYTDNESRKTQHFNTKKHKRFISNFQKHIKCECGGAYINNNGMKSRHLNTKKHKNFISNLS